MATGQRLAAAGCRDHAVVGQGRGLDRELVRPGGRLFRRRIRRRREAMALAAATGVDLEGLDARFADRARRAGRYATAWAPYVWPVSGAADLKVAP